MPGGERQTNENPDRDQTAASEAVASRPSLQASPEQRHVIRSSPPVYESPLDKLQGLVTPTHLFFVRNHFPTPTIDLSQWRLRVEGSAVRRPTVFGYDDILAMPSRVQLALLECAGNGRSLYRILDGWEAPGVQWGMGGVSLGEWTGVSLRDILRKVGLKANAEDVLLEGLDEGRVARPIPLRAALSPGAMLAHALNGQPLSPDNGFPLRAVIPGWTGVSNIKWLGRISVEGGPVKTRYNTEEYVLKGAGHPGSPPVTSYSIKSVVALPWEAFLPAGDRMVRGLGWSPHGKIARVDISLDGGKNWAVARLLQPNVRYAWTRWEFLWHATTGSHTIMTRAIDDKGNTQPDVMPPNDLGYLYNAVVPHPVRVNLKEISGRHE